MFDPREDKKILQEEFKKMLNKELGFGVKLFWSFLRCSKIAVMYIFTLVGFSFFMYHFIFGQPYVCSEYNENSIDSIDEYYTSMQETLLSGCYTNYDELENKYDTCVGKNMNLSNSCNKYCLTEMFGPVCDNLG